MDGHYDPKEIISIANDLSVREEMDRSMLKYDSL